MAATISVVMLRRLIAERAKLPLDVVDMVAEAQAEVLRQMLVPDVKVRFLDGWFVVKERKASRRIAPNGEWVDVPAKRQRAYVEPIAKKTPAKRRANKK